MTLTNVHSIWTFCTPKGLHVKRAWKRLAC